MVVRKKRACVRKKLLVTDHSSGLRLATIVVASLMLLVSPKQRAEESYLQFVLMPRDGKSSVARKARGGKRPADDSNEETKSSPSKRRRTTNDSVQESLAPAVQPINVTSNAGSNLASVSVGSVASIRHSEDSFWHQPETTQASLRKVSTEAVLSTPPNAVTKPQKSNTQQQNNNKKNKVRVVRKPSNSEKTTREEEVTAPEITSDETRKTRVSSLFAQLLLVGSLLIFFGDVNLFSNLYKRVPVAYKRRSLSNSTALNTTYSVQRPPHTITATTSRHLLELDDYEKQQLVLLQTEKRLAKTLVELADSQHDAVAARRQVTTLQEVYASVARELEESQTQLSDYQERLTLALHELSFTRQELEQTQWDLVMATADVETLSDHFNEACQYIEELFKLLEFQEKVATKALNFVATTAVKARQQEEEEDDIASEYDQSSELQPSNG